MTAKSNKLYTLAEAKVELHKSQCRVEGHELTIYVDDLNDPTRIQCGRCGRQWPIERGDDEAKEGEGGEATTIST